MKYPHEIKQMKAIAAALENLWRVAFNDESAVVEYKEDIDCLSVRSEAMTKIANTAGDSAPAAVYDFIERTIGRMR